MTNVSTINVDEHRKTEADVNPIFPHRWSPRAMNGEDVTPQELAQLFEAARWAPSSYNMQPWKFLFALRGTDHWQGFFDLLVEFNQSWAGKAGALLVVLSRNCREDGQPITSHAFDTGAAWQNLALQGSNMGLVIHAMEGFDKDKARQDLHIPPEYDIHAMVAVGRPGEVQTLPEFIRGGETPNDRKPLEEVAAEGLFA